KSKQLATIVRDLEFDISLEDAVVGRFDVAEMTQLFRELEFRSLLNRLPESSIEPSPATPAAEPINKDSHRTTVRTETELAELVSCLESAEAYAIDVETDSTEPISANL